MSCLDVDQRDMATIFNMQLYVTSENKDYTGKIR